MGAVTLGPCGIETRAVVTLRPWLNKGCCDIWAVVTFGPRYQ